MPAADSLISAGRWLLDSGIQAPQGGFARYYDSATGRNRAVSTEISGYAASALVYLFRMTRDEAYLDCARRTARFLLAAWDPALRTFPFEHPSPSPESAHQAYFFDCGIIVRGLLSVWRETQEEQLLEIARAAARGMIADFHAGPDYHPIVALPGKEPLTRSDHWSRTSGCYQLKSALAWWNVSEITGDADLRDAWFECLATSLATHSGYPEQASDLYRSMDRLHPYCYFLEGLMPMLDRPECAQAYVEAVDDISLKVNEIQNEFIRADVLAQLLRARIYGAALIPASSYKMDLATAAWEATTLAGFQSAGGDPRIAGGYFFGRRDGRMSSHVSPVSTAFGMQALEMWRRFQLPQPAGSKPPCIHLLI